MKREVRRLNDEERVSSRKIQENLSLTNVSRVTIRRALAMIGFRRTKAKQKPVLDKGHKLARVELCRKWLKERHDWSITIFTDEKKTNLDGPDQLVYLGRSRAYYT